MSFASLVKKAERLIISNSPTILTAIGVTGTLTTAYFTGSASFKAAEVIRQCRLEADISTDPKLEPDFKGDFKSVWKLYIPAAGTAILTIACIVCSNRIGTRRAAAMATAYAISEKAFTEYKEKVVEKIGDTKEQRLRDELAQDRIDRNPVGDREVIIAGSGQVLCFDEFTSRYFTSSMEELKKAQNEVNYKMLHDTYASLTDFYDEIGLAKTTYSDQVGWNCDMLLELRFSTCLSEDDKPCISVGFRRDPVKDFYHLK